MSWRAPHSACTWWTASWRQWATWMLWWPPSGRRQTGRRPRRRCRCGAARCVVVALRVLLLCCVVAVGLHCTQAVATLVMVDALAERACSWRRAYLNCASEAAEASMWHMQMLRVLPIFFQALTLCGFPPCVPSLPSCLPFLPTSFLSSLSPPSSFLPPQAPPFQLSKEQAEGVLGMTLRRLTSLEANKLQEEQAVLRAK